ncbi:DMT family transporter [Brevibacillus sp. H7]|jgi:drug/metabolite transporter (DMT)-like permease|uniref:DMT family transporter n=1 Tax=Brevibacillus sp. H7 TaxID=3349138 RepID=UPI003828E7F6
MIIGYVVMCLIFGTTYFMIKIGLEEGIPPFLFAGLRFFLAGAIVLLFMAWRKQFRWLTLREYGEMAILGLLMTTIPFAALFWGEQYISSGTAALLVASAPIFTTLVSVFYKQIRFRWYVLAGLLLSVSGAALILSNQLDGEDYGWYSFFSKLFIIASELFFSIGAVRSRKIVKKLSPFVFNGYQMVFASIGLFLISAVTEPIAAVAFTASSLLALFYLAVVASIIASTIYYWLVKETNATFPTTWTYVAPVIAMGIGAAFLGEQLTVIGICGGIGVLTGILLLNWETWGKLVSVSSND